eukprot:GDKJ01061967.1.p1 GENE.GDKJ01061967.1~~GDKJ01061967.1.p1  ORF type:complete len:160 (+),score=28.79 GDKJ01061967.1:1-480(+)
MGKMENPEKVVLDNKLAPVPLDSMDGKKLGFFFSGSWCPGCKEFLKPLVAFYNFFKPQESLEIIMIPFEQSKEAHEKYISSVPWYSLPHGNYHNVVNFYKYKGFPSLLVVNPEGREITQLGVFAIRDQDPYLLDQIAKHHDKYIPAKDIIEHYIWRHLK